LDGEPEAMSIAIRQLVSSIGSFKKAAIFSDSTAVIHSLTKIDALPSKRVTKIHSSTNPLNAKLNPICHLLALLEAHHILHVSRIRVKQLKGLQKDKIPVRRIPLWGCG
jgi:hypothetical protein